MLNPQFILNLPATKNTTSRVIFSDINFRSSSIGNDDLALNLRTIAHNIMTILGTYKKQRLFHPQFGANLEQFLFDPVDVITEDAIRAEILRSVPMWEPEVEVLDRDIEILSHYDEEFYEVTMKFRVPRLDVEASMSFNLLTAGK